MTDDLPRRVLRRDLAFMVSAIAVLSLFVLSCLSFAIALDRRDAHNTIAGLQAAQTETSETTNCVRLFAANRDSARDARDTALADAIVIAVSRGDTAAAVAVYQAANERAKAASKAYGDYLKDPVLPCPTAS